MICTVNMALHDSIVHGFTERGSGKREHYSIPGVHGSACIKSQLHLILNE